MAGSAGNSWKWLNDLNGAIDMSPKAHYFIVFDSKVYCTLMPFMGIELCYFARAGSCAHLLLHPFDRLVIYYVSRCIVGKS